jgi:hypothetical protein
MADAMQHIIDVFRDNGLIVTTPAALAQLVQHEINKNQTTEITRAQALEILGISKTSFERFEKEADTFLIKTKSGGRGKKSLYLRSSVVAEYARIKNK